MSRTTLCPVLVALFAACGQAGTGPGSSLPPPPPPVPVGPVSLTLIEGEGQSLSPSSTPATAPAVLLKNRQGNPVPGVLVTFAVRAGAGSLRQDTIRTDANGIAKAVGWRLGPLPGVNTLQVTADTISPVIVSAMGRILVPTTLDTGVVALPAQAKVTPASLRLRTLITDVPVAADGSFTAIVEPDGAQLAMVATTAGTPLLLGWLDDTHHALNVRTTAEVLAYFDLGAYMLTDFSERQSVRRLLETADLAALEAAVTTGLGADAAIVTLSTPGIDQARSAAIRSLAAGAVGGPLRGILIDPEVLQSGVALDQPGFRSFTLTNNYRRRVAAFVDRLYYRTREGDSIPSVKRGEPIYLTSVPYVTSPIGALAEVASGARLTEPVISDPIEMPLFPADAAAVGYRVTLVGMGIKPYPPQYNTEMTPAQWDAKTLVSLQTLFLDIVIPFVDQFLNLENEKRNRRGDAEMAPIIAQILDLNPTEVIAALNAGDLSKAFEEALKILVDSDALQNGLFDTLVGPLLRSKGISGDLAEGWVNVKSLLGKVEAVATGYALFKSWMDVSDARQIERWNVTVTSAEIAMLPSAALIHQNEVQTFKATVTEASDDAGPSPVFHYRWSTTGNFGEICAQFHGCGTSFEASVDQVTYSPEVLKEGTDEVRVQVFYVERGIERIVGDAKATVTTWAAKVSIAPLRTSLKKNETQRFIATVDGPLQSDIMTYRWITPGAFGSLLLGSKNYEGSLNWTDYTVTSGQKGTETVTVEVYSGTNGRRLLGRATATVLIEPGKETVVSGSWAVVTTGMAGGRSCVTAQLSFPLVEGATSYRVHAYGYHDRTGSYGTEMTRDLIPPFRSFQPCGDSTGWGRSGVDGNRFVYFLSGSSVPASGLAEAEASMNARFAGMTVDVTVAY